MAIRVERPPGVVRHTIDAIQRVSFFPGVMDEVSGEYRILRPFYQVDLPDLQMLLQERLHSEPVSVESDAKAPRVYKAVIDLGSSRRRVGICLNVGDNVAYSRVTAAASLWEYNPRDGEFKPLRFRRTEAPVIALDTIEEYVSGMFDKILKPDQIKPL